MPSNNNDHKSDVATFSNKTSVHKLNSTTRAISKKLSPKVTAFISKQDVAATVMSTKQMQKMKDYKLR